MKKFVTQTARTNVIFLLAAAWLFTLAFIVDNYWYASSSVRYLHKNIQQDIQEQERDFEKLVADTVLLKKLVNESYNENELLTFLEKRYCFSVYSTDISGAFEHRFWNNQLVNPDNYFLKKKEENVLDDLDNGQYVFKRKQTTLSTGRPVWVLAFIPVRREYYIQVGNYLKSEFINYDQAEKNILITTDSTDYGVKSINGNTLFYLQKKFIAPGDNSNNFSLTLNILAFLLLLMALHNIAHAISEEYGYFRGVLFLTGWGILVRGITYYFPHIISVKDYGLFDPLIYSSSRVLNSLGDLMINAFLFCWIVLFIRREVGNRRFRLTEKSKKKWPALFIPLVLLVSITFLLASIIKSLISDARISFNVTNFFGLNAYSYIGFIVMGTLALSFFYFSQVIMQLIGPLLSQGNKSMLFVWVAVIGLILLTLIRNTSYIEMNIYVLIWLLAYLWFMQQQTASAAGFKMAVSEVLVWLFIFSASISTVIIAENKKIELEQRKSSAEKLASLADRSGEKLISIALRYLDDEFLSANFSRFYDESSNLYLKDSIISSNFNVYTSRYNTRMFTFDSSSKVPRGLFNTIVGSFDTLNTIWRSAKITDIPELHYYEKSFDKFSYICRRTITNEFGTLQGYIFIELMPKEHKSDALEPELFKNQKDSYVENGQNYTYAIYNDGMLKNHSNSYSFPLRLTAKEIPRLETELRRNKGYDEFWYRDNNKVVVIARQHNYTLEAITLFAWIFTTFLILLGLFRLIAILIQTRLKLSLLKQYFQLNLRSQIHGTFISITLLSFVVIGITTIVFFIGRYERNNRNRLSKAIQIMNKQVEAEIKRSETFDDMVKFYQAGANNRLMEMVERVSEIHGADINFYDLNGKLVVPSNPIIYNKGVLSAWMSPQAYHELKRNRVVEFINKEQMGDISYQSIYCPVRDAQGKPYAYLNIPSFDSQDELKKEISNFFVTIINLTAFIFLIAGAVALVITNRITSSFTMIVNKMQAINLGKDNEEIPWDRDDEIGGLVKEYNKMVNKLEASAAQLAKSEREGAWREMARQVAHEIKNPLTPMKLSIQYLQKAIASNTPNVKELTANVASTLVEQIDHLARIAADFSQFANIGNPKNEKFDLHDLLQSLSLLYATNDKLEFTWKRVEQPVIIMADKTQLNRLFTNLLQNAAEACQNQFIRRVLITESLNGNYITIVISDNGEGIPTAVQEKIFTPNFTTKTSGTGLGLAMSKSIVEQAKGEIWFTTKEGIGSNFFVKLPVIKST